VGKTRPTPFAADSGFAACGYAPRASKGFGRRRRLACAAAAAKTNRWADGYAARQMPRSPVQRGRLPSAKLPAAPVGLSPAGERGIRAPEWHRKQHG